MRHISFALLLVVLSSLAVAANAFVIQGGPTVHSRADFMVNNFGNSALTPLIDMPGDQVWFVVPGYESGVNYCKVSYPYDPFPQFKFKFWVESYASDPSVTIKVWGAKDWMSDIIGTQWAMHRYIGSSFNGSVGSGRWTADMTSPANPFISFTISDTSAYVGEENALYFTLFHALDEPIPYIPEPSSLTVLISALGGASGFVVLKKRR